MDLQEMNLAALKEEAKKLGIKGSTKSKDELKELILQHTSESEESIPEGVVQPPEVEEPQVINSPLLSVAEALITEEEKKEIDNFTEEVGDQTWLGENLEPNVVEETQQAPEGEEIFDSFEEEIKEIEEEEEIETKKLDLSSLSPAAKKWLDYFHLQKGKTDLITYLDKFDNQYQGRFKGQSALNEIKKLFGLSIKY